MGFRFRKSIKIAPGIRMNVSKSGVGLSFGGPGLRYSINSSGRRTTTIGLPGTGLSYSTTSGTRSYKTQAYQRRNDLIKMQREQHNLQEQEYARLQVNLYENRLEQIRSIHHECDDPIDWQEIYQRMEPYKYGKDGPNTKAARLKQKSYLPGVMDRLFHRSEAKIQKHYEEIEKAKLVDQDLWDSWKNMHETAKRILQGDIDTYLEVIQEFAPLNDLVEFGSGFEFGTNDPNVIHVNFDVNAKTIVPEKAISLTKTGRLSEKALSKTAYFDIYQDYVCSCALRIARDMFALLPVSYCFIHAEEDRLNPSTGYMENITILSVKYNRQTLNRLNFTHLDPSDALANFPHKMKFKKTQGFEDVGDNIQ